VFYLGISIRMQPSKADIPQQFLKVRRQDKYLGNILTLIRCYYKPNVSTNTCRQFGANPAQTNTERKICYPI